MNPTPRVLILPASYGSTARVVGGGERYAYEYARALAELTPVTLALFGPQPDSRAEGPLRVRVFKGETGRVFFWPPSATRAEILTHDVFHPMIFPTSATDYLLLLARWAKKRVVLTDVGGGGRCISSWLRRRHASWDLNRWADGLAPISQHSAGFFAEWPQPTAVLLGGIRAAWQPASRPRGGFALFVGRLLPHKGVLHLIEAMPPDIVLKIVGESYDAPYEARLRVVARGRSVEFVGRVSDDELDDLYARAAVVVQPSLPMPGEDKSELLGLAAIEAMAHGTPVIVTQSGSLPELVIPDETGFIVPPGDRQALRSRIELLCHDQGLSLRMGAAARRHAWAKFTWEAAARRGLDLYQQLWATS